MMRGRTMQPISMLFSHPIFALSIYSRIVYFSTSTNAWVVSELIVRWELLIKKKILKLWSSQLMCMFDFSMIYLTFTVSICVNGYCVKSHLIAPWISWLLFAWEFLTLDVQLTNFNWTSRKWSAMIQGCHRLSNIFAVPWRAAKPS